MGQGVAEDALKRDYVVGKRCPVGKGQRSSGEFGRAQAVDLETL
jgi:hypothetical protein